MKSPQEFKKLVDELLETEASLKVAIALNEAAKVAIEKAWIENAKSSKFQPEEILVNSEYGWIMLHFSESSFYKFRAFNQYGTVID